MTEKIKLVAQLLPCSHCGSEQVWVGRRETGVLVFMHPAGTFHRNQCSMPQRQRDDETEDAWLQRIGPFRQTVADD